MKGFARLLSGLALAVCLFGQAAANKGQIVGTVLDQNQAVIPNAKVIVKSPSTGATRELTTGNDGRFQALFLDAGSYDIVVSATGFAEARLTNVIVNVGSSVDLPVALSVGATSQSIEVGAQLVSVDLPAPQVITGEAQSGARRAECLQCHGVTPSTSCRPSTLTGRSSHRSCGPA